MSLSEGAQRERPGGERRGALAGDDEQTAIDALAARRLRVALSLTAVMLVIYFGFILLVAFGKDFLGNTLTEGLSIGILLGVLVILSTWVVTWIYIRWANRHYEPAARRLRR